MFARGRAMARQHKIAIASGVAAMPATTGLSPIPMRKDRPRHLDVNGLHRLLKRLAPRKTSPHDYQETSFHFCDNLWPSYSKSLPPRASPRFRRPRQGI